MDFERRNADEWNDKTISPQPLIDRNAPPALGQSKQAATTATQNEKRLAGRYGHENGVWPIAKQALDPHAQSFQPKKNAWTQQRSYARVLDTTTSQHTNTPRQGQPAWPGTRKPNGKPGASNRPRDQIAGPKNVINIQQPEARINRNATSSTTAHQIQDFQSLGIPEAVERESPQKSLAHAKEPNELKTTQEQPLELRHKPNAALFLGFTGFMPWPTRDVPLSSLGTEFSRLDKTRKDYQCHIVFDEKASAFKLYGESLESVSRATKAIKALLQEALIFEMPPSRTILIDVEEQNLQDRVVMLDIGNANLSFKAAGLPAGKRGGVACLAPASTTSQLHQEWNHKASNPAALNLRVLRVALSDIVANMRLHGKRIRLQCVLGVFVWHSYWWQPKEAQDQPIIPFVQNSRDQKAQGSIYGVTSESKLLAKLFQSKSLFRPRVGRVENLDDLRPSYEGYFSLDGERSANSNTNQLIVVAKENRQGHGEIVRKTWEDDFRDNEYGFPSEVYMVHLQGGLSWSLKSSLCPISKPVSEEQRNFAQSVKIAQVFRPWSSKNGTLKFDFPSARVLRSFTQKTVWRFRLTDNSQYSLDVIKAERFDITPIKPGNHRRLLESHWRVEIQNERWTALARPLPQGSSSGLKVSDIFPDNGKAYDIDLSLESFVDTMRQIVDTLHRSQISP